MLVTDEYVVGVGVYTVLAAFGDMSDAALDAAATAAAFFVVGVLVSAGRIIRGVDLGVDIWSFKSGCL